MEGNSYESGTGQKEWLAEVCMIFNPCHCVEVRLLKINIK